MFKPLIWIIPLAILLFSGILFFFGRNSRRNNFIQFYITIVGSLLGFALAILLWQIQLNLENKNRIQGLIQSTLNILETKESYIDILHHMDNPSPSEIDLYLSFENPIDLVINDGTMFTSLSDKLQTNIAFLVSGYSSAVKIIARQQYDKITLDKYLKLTNILLQQQKNLLKLELSLINKEIETESFNIRFDSINMSSSKEFITTNDSTIKINLDSTGTWHIDAPEGSLIDKVLNQDED